MSEITDKSVHWSFWVISAAFLLYNMAGVVNFSMQMNAHSLATYPEAARSLIEGRPAWATSAFAVAVFGGALGCVLLLLRKSVASYVFIASLLGALVTMIHTLGLAGSHIAAGELIAGNIVQLVVTVLLIWYSRYAGRRIWIS